jgi:hypothetical protein
MSDNDSNFGYWIPIIGIGACVLYFWREVLTYILEFILGIIKLIQAILTEIVSIGLLIGGIYIVVKIFEAIKKK